MKRLQIVVVLCLLSVLSGCIIAAVAAGGTGVFYAKGAAKKSYSHGVERTFNAAVAALNEADVAVLSKQVDATAGKIEGSAADGKKVIIDFKATGENVTEVKIRVGTLGNRERAEYIFSKIDARL